MSIINALPVFLGVITVLCGWWLFFIVQQDYWLDLTRQRLFLIRNKLYDAALEGRISFDDPAYTMTRTTLNGMLRFTHEVNIMYLISVFLAHKYVYKGRRSTDYQNQFDDAIKNLSMENRKLILRTIAESHITILRHIMSTSPILWPILKPLSIILAVFNKTKKVRRMTMRGKKRKEPWSVIDAEANYIAKHQDDGLLSAAA